MSYIYKRGVYTTILLVVLLGGCIEQIEFDTERKSGRLIVDGKITNGTGPYTLRLSRTSETTPVLLGGAVITIFDDQKNAEQYREMEEGIYQLEGDIVKGEKGRTYFIEIELLDGTRYRSKPETMPQVIVSNSMYFEFDEIEELASNGVTIEKYVVNVFINTSIPNSRQPLFLKWDVEEVYKFTGFDFPDPFRHPPPVCYVTADPSPQNILLFNGNELQTKKIDGQLVVTREIDFTFYQRHYINVILSSITKNAYNYWEKVDQVINRAGTIFDVPPATVRGNIFNVNNPNERVLGYFEAALTDTTRLFWVRANMPVLIQHPCRRLTRPECRNCLLFDNSFHDPPSWWLKE